MARQGRRATRRGFLKAAGAAVAAPYFLTSTALGARGRSPANDRIVMAAIGTGGRGGSNMRGFTGRGGVQMVAVCDVRQDRRHRYQNQAIAAIGLASWRRAGRSNEK